MKKLLFLTVGAFLLGVGFACGVAYQIRAQGQEIADVEAVAIEVCNTKIKNIKKLCKKGC